VTRSHEIKTQQKKKGRGGGEREKKGNELLTKSKGEKGVVEGKLRSPHNKLVLKEKGEGGHEGGGELRKKRGGMLAKKQYQLEKKIKGEDKRGGTDVDDVVHEKRLPGKKGGVVLGALTIEGERCQIDIKIGKRRPKKVRQGKRPKGRKGPA